jgi:hypothetical protein
MLLPCLQLASRAVDVCDARARRLEDVRLHLRRWLDAAITTAELDARVRSHLTGDHPADSQILEDFTWFVRSSNEFHERRRSDSASPRSNAVTAAAIATCDGAAADLPAAGSTTGA